ncbi:MAG: CPBP family intramembrane glutamic endopeptidase [Tepidisphaerales bacterium]
MPPETPGDDIPVARRVQYCGRCGAILLEGSGDCAACAQRTARQSANRTYSAEWSDIKSAMMLYFSLLAVSVVTIIVLLSSKGEMGVTGEIVASSAMSLIVLVWSIARHDRVRRLLFSRSRIRWYFLALGCPIATFLLAALCIQLLVRLFQVEPIAYLAPYQREGWSFVWPVLLICVQPAVFEELAFRGVIQGSIEAVVGPWQGVLVSAAMFAIIHLSIPSLPHLLTLGIVLGWLRMGSGSIYPGMIVHFLHNLLVLLDERSGGFLKW